MDDDPFVEIRFHQTASNREFLTEEELNKLIEKEFTIPRMEIVRDIFVFCSLTGLAFTDVQHLKPEHTWTVVIGFAKQGKRQIICAIYLYSIFR